MIKRFVTDLLKVRFYLLYIFSVVTFTVIDENEVATGKDVERIDVVLNSLTNASSNAVGKSTTEAQGII